MTGWAFLLPIAAQTGGIDWATLPALPWRTPPQATRAMNDFVWQEARLRRCPVPAAEAGLRKLTVDLAVLVDAQGQVRAVVPRAIQCPSVEQFAAGIIANSAMQNNLLPGGRVEQWYRTSLTFTWRT